MRNRELGLLLALGLLASTITATAATANGAFSDDDGSVFEADIEWLANSGITKGCNPPTNDKFCPNDYVTRGQMAAFLVRALAYTDDGNGDLFTDDDDSIFEADIDKLATAGVTKGCNPPANDAYCPTSRVTRGQMAAFLVRALGYGDDGGGDLFTDDDDSIFEADIDKLGAAQVTRGCNPPDNDLFCPNDYVTRGQMAAFLHRSLVPRPASADVASYFGSLPTWEEDPPSDDGVFHEKVEFSDEPTGDPSPWKSPPDNSDLICSEQDFNLETTPEDLVTFDTLSDVLWPGALLQGNTYEGGDPKELPIRQRAPIAIFLDLSRSDLRRVVYNPTPGRLAEAVGDVIEHADNAGYEPAVNFFAEKHETYAARQFALHLGMSARFMSTAVRTSLDMARTAEEHTVTFYFKETAFTANAELPQTPGGFFSSDLTPTLIQEQINLGRMGEGNLPVFVKSVTYGRILVFSITSTMSVNDIKAAVEAVHSKKIYEFSGEAEVAYRNMVAEGDFRAYGIGGSQESVNAVVSSGRFQDYFGNELSLSEYTPISYVIEDLYGNTAYLGETTDYTATTCIPLPDPAREHYDVRLSFKAARLNDFVDSSATEFDLNGFFLEAGAWDNQNVSGKYETPILPFIGGCDVDPDGTQPYYADIFCWKADPENDYYKWYKGDFWPPGEQPVGPDNELTVSFDNTGASGYWGNAVLELRAGARDYDSSSGDDWCVGPFTESTVLSFKPAELFSSTNETDIILELRRHPDSTHANPDADCDIDVYVRAELLPEP